MIVPPKYPELAVAACHPRQVSQPRANEQDLHVIDMM